MNTRKYWIDNVRIIYMLNALFGPCGLVSIMAVCVGVVGCKSKVLKLGICLMKGRFEIHINEIY